MAPAAARRAKPVQRNYPQGLQGNPDACRPRRGSACNVSEHGAPAEAQRSGFGGESFPAERRQWRIKRAGKKERRDWRASLARESQCRDGSKGTVEGVSFAACGEANDLKLVPTKRAAMRGWFFALSVQPAAAMIPRTGGARAGEAPRPFFPPISSGRNGGARRAGAPREGAPPMNGRPQVAPTDDQSLTLAKPGDHGRMISAPTGPAMVSRTRY